MPRLILLTTVACLLVLAPGQHATATTINFDVAADGVTPVASGTNITTLYSSLGVTFGCLNTLGSNECAGNPTNVFGTGNAYALASLTAASAPNAISLIPFNPVNAIPAVLTDEAEGSFSATFSSARNSVSIDAEPFATRSDPGSSNGVPFLQAFDSLGNEIAEADYAYGSCDPATTQCPYETLLISRPSSDIAFVVFSSTGLIGTLFTVPVFGEFDNLTFGGGGRAVPEPTSVLLLGSGLVGLAAWRRMGCR
jgi:hypothetical protein